MEPLPSETPFKTTLGCDSGVEDNSKYLKQCLDTWWQNNFMDKQILAGESFFTPAKDPPAFFSQQISKLASPPCSEFNSIEIAASEGFEAVHAGSSCPALDLKDSDYGGENNPETRQQSLEVASPVNTSELLRSCQVIWDEAEAVHKTNPMSPAILGGEITEHNPTFRAGYCHPELGDPEPSIFRNAFGTELSRGNSTDTKYNACAKGPKRGHRSPNWTGEEKDAFLKVKVEARTTVKGKDWEFISKALKDRYAFERSAKSCENLWGTLLKSFKVIRQHESMNHSNNWCSYWELDENGRSKLQLPKSFSFRWYKMIESICAGKERRAAIDRQTWTTKDPDLTSLGGAGECSSLLRLADGLINLQRDLQETSTSSTLTMSKQELGPYLQNVVIDALQSALKPLATSLQYEHEEKQKFNAKMKALDKKRRALDLEEIQIKCRHFGQCQCNSRSTCRPKQQAGG